MPFEPYKIFNEVTKNCQSMTIQTSGGPLEILWPKDRTLDEMAGAWLADLYRLDKAGLLHKVAQK